MSQTEKRREGVTKEIFIAITPFLASYLWTIFYDAGYAHYFGIPFDLITLNLTDILLTNRLALIAAVIGFLWIGLYYNMLPSARSLVFQMAITIILALSIGMGSLFGYGDARKQDHFLVERGQQHVVLKIYGDQLVMAPYQPDEHTVERAFLIRKIGRDPNLVLELTNTGRLQPINH